MMPVNKEPEHDDPLAEQRELTAHYGEDFQKLVVALAEVDLLTSKLLLRAADAPEVLEDEENLAASNLLHYVCDDAALRSGKAAGLASVVFGMEADMVYETAVTSILAGMETAVVNHRLTCSDPTCEAPREVEALLREMEEPVSEMPSGSTLN